MKKVLLLLLLLISLIYSQDSLKILANNLGVEIGTAYGSVWRIDNVPYANSFAVANYDWFTVTSDFLTLCPTALNQYNFTDLDSLVNFAYRNDKKIHMNCVFFGATSRVPAWIQSGGYSKEEVRSIITNYIDTLFKRYDGRIISYEIVNELMSNADYPYDTTTWFELNAGPMWFQYPINYANSVKGGAKIGIADGVNVETFEKRRNFIKLLKLCKTLNLDFDFIAMQEHLVADTGGYWNQSAYSNFLRVVDSIYNIPVYVTEFDLRLPKIVADSSLNMQRQAKMAAGFWRTAIAGGVRRITQWIWNDGDSWIDAAVPGWGYACLYGAWNGSEYPKKRAYNAVVEMLRNYSKSQKNDVNQIKIWVNNTMVADSQANYCHRINLRNINPYDRNNFFSKITSNRSNVIVTDTTDNVLPSYISGIDTAKEIAILNVLAPIYPDKYDQYFIIKYGDDITTGVNDISCFSSADVVASIDFSNKTTITDESGNVIFDSTININAITVDTSNRFGWYFKLNGSSYAFNKTSAANLAINSGTISMISRNDSTDISHNRYYYALGNLAGTYAIGQRTILTGSNSEIIRVAGTSTTYTNATQMFDSTFRYSMLTWGSGSISPYYGDRYLKSAKTYVGTYTTTEGRLNLFCDFARTANSGLIGSVAYLRVYNNIKDNKFRATESNMVMDNANFYIFGVRQPATNKYQRNSIFTMYNSNYGSTTGQVKLNNVLAPITFWSNDSVKIRIPSWMGRGYYTYKVYNTAGTLVDSTYHGVRIMVPQITGGE